MPVTLGSVLATAIGTTAPFSAISGASRLTLSDGSARLAVERLERVGLALQLEGVGRPVLGVGIGESRKREGAQAEAREAAGDGALQDGASRGIGRVGKFVHCILSL